MLKTNRIKKTAVALTSAVVLATGLASSAGAQERLFFSSDVHNKQELLFDHVESACENEGCDLVGLVGDFNSGDPWEYQSTRQDILDITSGIEDILGPDANVMFSQGNHDETNTAFATYLNMGLYTSGPQDQAGGDNFDVYIINVYNFNMRADRFGYTQCEYLESYLASHDTKKPIFIFSHYPFHSSRTGIDQDAATCFYNAMSDAAATGGQNIVYVWGHNHRDAGLDENLNLIAGPGDTILMDGEVNHEVNEHAESELNFTVINAGYVKPRENQNPPSENAVSSWVVVEVYSTLMNVTRYGNQPMSKQIALQQ